MPSEDEDFRDQIEDLLHAHGLRFQGIRLTCRHCGEPAFAASPEMACGFGWSKLTVIKGSHYSGVCITCDKLPLNERRTHHE